MYTGEWIWSGHTSSSKSDWQVLASVDFNGLAISSDPDLLQISCRALTIHRADARSVVHHDTRHSTPGTSKPIAKPYFTGQPICPPCCQIFTLFTCNQPCFSQLGLQLSLASQKSRFAVGLVSIQGLLFSPSWNQPFVAPTARPMPR